MSTSGDGRQVTTRESVETVPVAVIIPTYGRGARVLTTLERLFACSPLPSQILIHIDQPDGDLGALLTSRYPSVQVLTSRSRLGPGGGRHRCLEACTVPYAVSFDDDSYPVDLDFFRSVVSLFERHPDAAVVGARIWHRNQPIEPRSTHLLRTRSYTGCGYAVRLSVYRRTRGHIPRPVPYGMEETDLALLLFAMNCAVYESSELRVFHDTDLGHHQRPDITEGVIANVALFAFLHYPFHLWGRGLLQLANTVYFCLKMGRWRGILGGLAGVPADCLEHRDLRRPLPSRLVSDFLALGREQRVRES